MPNDILASLTLSPDRYKFQVTIGGETLEKITALLAELAKRKFADTRRPRSSRRSNLGERNTSAAIGKPAGEGIPLRCRQHNDYEGRLYFGERRRRDSSRAGRGLVPEQVRLSASHSSWRPRASLT
jgi:hypothetical protein